MLPARPAIGWDCHVHVFDGSAKVAPGHYAPLHRPLAAIETLALRHSVGHLVLVQPSVYSSDNSVLLDALRTQPGRHRGVVVLDSSVSDAALTDMHRLGVRGVRFNLVSPAGNQQNLADEFAKLAPRLRALNWHVQWYARPEDLPVVFALQQTTSVPAVLDHLGGIHANLPLDHTAWHALEQLAGHGAWVKLSGWYRLQSVAPYQGLDRNIDRVAKLFASRILWGSDWPHTSFAANKLPAYASTLEPVIRVLTDGQRTDVLHHAPERLYA